MNRFLSFADSRMAAALERLGRQAEALEFFDEITLFTEHDLSAEFTGRMGCRLWRVAPDTVRN